MSTSAIERSTAWGNTLDIQSMGSAQSPSEPSARRAWERLATRVETPNPFYEPFSLLPALEHLAPSRGRLVLVRHWTGSTLDAVFPLHVVSVPGLYRYARLWKHRECFCVNPLLERPTQWPKIEQRVRAALRLDWLTGSPITTALPVARGSRSLTIQIGERPALDADRPFEQMMTDWRPKRRRERQRMVNRLMEHPDIRYGTLEEPGKSKSALRDFIKLERSGWKGEQGTAIGCATGTQAYYHQMTAAAAPQARISFQQIVRSDQLIAASIRLHGGDTAFEIKTTYDERESARSPGQVLELLNMSQLASSGFRLADSCTAPDNPLLNALWSERLPVYAIHHFSGSPAGLLARCLFKLKKGRHQVPADTLVERAGGPAGLRGLIAP